MSQAHHHYHLMHPNLEILLGFAQSISALTKYMTLTYIVNYFFLKKKCSRILWVTFPFFFYIYILIRSYIHHFISLVFLWDI